MGKKATTIDVQIAKLRSRGMILDLDIEKIKEHLLDIGYYRLGFYWYPFEVDAKHNFEIGTKFSTVIDLYYLDVDLRYILIKYINRLELNFRTNLIYWVSTNYDNNPIWYTDNTIMSFAYLKDIKSHYNNNFKKKNLLINKHHVNNPLDKYAPCWKTFEYYTFGSIVKVYENIIDDEVRKLVSTQYNIKKPVKLQNILDTLVFVRNSCAHSGVIYDLHIDEGVVEMPSYKFNNDYSHSLDAAIKALLYVMEYISLDRKKELEIKLDKLFNKFKANQTIKTIIEDKLGYVYSC
ncbi:Abi family protein [Winogradskyella thalassocola]|uniref:Abortive infection bacteriophage resistance protein n=1 Tax=Winogradskyella thalassocola TaxID=262004 RepID=A0A1G8FGJ4_9FLAO|nr:Abi family protein [Winogradskyella thalassocola]SDH81192.1 Abortive infection bacteriophage resistance protein [Winogradskyella thalassocola]